MKGGFDALSMWPDGADPADLARAAVQAGVGDWMHAGTHDADWQRATELAQTTGGRLALGLHPWWAQELDPDALDAQLLALFQRGPTVVGEVGLDAVRARSDVHRHRQRQALDHQLQWARSHERPLILHVVRALPEVLHLLKRVGLSAAGGVVHGWSGDVAAARSALDAGLHLSIGPGIRRQSGHKIRAAVAFAPCDRLLIETDGAPADLVGIARQVAQIRGGSAVETLEQTGYTARQLYAASPQPSE
ncbi:MAG: TatD family hydrolase [Myxococcota bacterium]